MKEGRGGQVEIKPSHASDFLHSKLVFKTSLMLWIRAMADLLSAPQLVLPGDSFGVTELASLISYVGKAEKEEEKRPMGFAV